MHTFNITGPCDPVHHDLPPPFERSLTAMASIRSGDDLAVSSPRQSRETSLRRILVIQA